MGTFKVSDNVRYEFDDFLYHSESVKKRLLGENNWGGNLEKDVEMQIGVILLTTMYNMDDEIVYRYIRKKKQVTDELIKERVSRLEKIFEHYFSILHPQEIKNFGIGFFGEIKKNADKNMRPYYKEMFGSEEMHIERWNAFGMYYSGMNWGRFKHGFEILSNVNKKYPFCEVKYIDLNNKEEDEYPLILDKLSTMITAKNLVHWFANKDVLTKFNKQMGEYEIKAMEDYFNNDNNNSKKIPLSSYKPKVVAQSLNCSDNKNIRELCIGLIENAMLKDKFCKEVNNAFQILSLSIQYGWELEKSIRKDKEFYIKNLYTIKPSGNDNDMVDMYINHEVIHNILRLSFIDKNTNKNRFVLFENSFFEYEKAALNWFLSERHWIACSEINEKIENAKKDMVWTGDEIQDENNIACIRELWENKVRDLAVTDCELFMNKNPINNLSKMENRSTMLIKTLEKHGLNIDVEYVAPGRDNLQGLLMSKLKFKKELVSVMEDIVSEISFMNNDLCEDYIERRVIDWVMRKDLSNKEAVPHKKKLNKF